MLGACGDFEDDPGPRAHAPILVTLNDPLRPPDPGNPAYDYEGVEVSSWSSPNGNFKVWWPNEGPHQPPLMDADQSGVPDFVEEIGRVGDNTIAWLIENGWRTHIADDVLPPSDGSFGEDGLFDVYLWDFAGSSDGQRVVDACDDILPGVRHCSGYFVMENDFRDSSYSSWQEGVQVLVSHEYFHAVQGAYQSDIPAWWSEATATWFEEAVEPSQSDFERLAGRFFNDAERSLTGPLQSFESYSYATSLFVYHIALTAGNDSIRDVFEQLDQGTELMTALDQVLQARAVGLQDTFQSFSLWNLFTSDRATAGLGYPFDQAARWPSVPVLRINGGELNWDERVEAFASKYAIMTVTEPLNVTLAQQDNKAGPPHLWVVTRAVTDNADLSLARGLSAGETLDLTPDDGPIYLILSNGSNARLWSRVRVRLGNVNPDPEPMPDPVEMTMQDAPTATPSDNEEGGCQAVPQRPAGTRGLMLLALLMLGVMRRRRPTPCG